MNNMHGFYARSVFILIFYHQSIAAEVSPPSPEDNTLYDTTLENSMEAGFRHALIKAREIKYQSNNIVDVIVAEDIADFPDLNIADSIQRMPGMSITREGGEGRRVSMRGIGSQFTKVSINNMNAMAFTSSPMDSRSAVENSRAFDFNLFASELFESVLITKSESADLTEGGIGGTIQFYTPKPFSQHGFRSTINLNTGANEYTDEDLSPRLTLLLSNTWDNTFGLLGAVSYSRRSTLETGYNTTRWRPRTTNDVNPAIDPELQTQFANGEVYFARGNRLSVWENSYERLGATTTFEFRPSIHFSLSANILYGIFNNDKDEKHLATAGSSSTGLGRLEALQTIRRDGHLEAVYAEFSDTPLKTQYRKDVADSDFLQFTLESTLNLSDRTTLQGLYGKSRASYDHPVSEKAKLDTIDNYGLTTDFTKDRFYGANRYQQNLLDVSRWQVKELDASEWERVDDLEEIKLDLRHNLSEIEFINGGLSYQTYTNHFTARQVIDYVKEVPTPQNDGDQSIGDRYFVFRGHADADWLLPDLDALIDYYAIDADLDITAARSSLPHQTTENTLAGYLQYEKTYEKLRGDIGLRYYTTDVTAQGRILNTDHYEVRKDTHNGFLPSINLAYELTPELIARLNLSQNITRPDLNQYHNTRSDFIDPENTQITQIHSASIKPYRSDNVNISLERFFDEVGYISLGFFHKKISHFPMAETKTIPYSETGYSEDFLDPGQTGETLFDYTRIVNNNNDTNLLGLELSFQRDFDFLPEPFHNLGIASNITLVSGDAIYDNVQGTGLSEVKPFPGLSKKSGNLTLYYEPNGWGSRISLAYRDDYILLVEPGLADEDERGFHSTVYLDFSAYYTPFENYKMTIEGINLTNEREEQYSDSADRLYNTTTSGRSLYIGMSYTF